MCVKPLTARTSPAIRVAASWISDARRRTEHPAAAQRNASLSAGPSTAAARPSSASIFTPVSASASAAAVPRLRSASQSVMASSRSACSIGDRTPCSGAAAHALRTASIASNWASVRPARAESARRLLDVLEPAPEERRASFDRGRGVVQLVGEARRQPPERDHLLVVQLVRRELPRPIEHPVDEDRRQPFTLPGEIAHPIPRHHEDFGGLLGERLARRRGEAGVRKHARDVATPPLHELVGTGSAIDEERDPARENHEETFHGLTLRREDVADVEPPDGPVRGQPLELLARRRADGAVVRQPIDEIVCRHGSDESYIRRAVDPGSSVGALRRAGRSARDEASPRATRPETGSPAACAARRRRRSRRRGRDRLPQGAPRAGRGTARGPRG